MPKPPLAPARWLVLAALASCSLYRGSAKDFAVVALDAEPGWIAVRDVAGDALGTQMRRSTRALVGEGPARVIDETAGGVVSGPPL